ncbi:MAG TPA: hypothetical protein VH105_24560 [Burkholderiales bacterium]|jgi:hypothetical protein|nr:hypothetical protein [Burkholderiales bacterium]
MGTKRTSAEAQGEQAQAPDATLAGCLRAWWANVHGMGRDYALLAVLEMQRAGIGLALILAAGVVVAVLIVTAWTAAVASLIVWAVHSGNASWPAALGVAAGVNVAIALMMLVQMRNHFSQIFLGATLRQLRGEGRGR